MGFLPSQGLLIQGLLYLSPRESLAAIEHGAVLVDLRAPDDVALKRFDVKHLIYMPYCDLKTGYARLPMARPLVLADSVGLRSKEALRFLREHGYVDVASLIGGIVDWQREGLPIHVDGFFTGQCACQLRPSNR
jgi:rhodanese-related sulfurtransferase